MTTNGIFLMRDRFQMLGPEAVLNPAQMVQFHAIRDRAVNEFVRPSVSADIAPGIIPKNAVASTPTSLIGVSPSGSCPKPTLPNVLAKRGDGTTKRDFFPKSILRLDRNWTCLFNFGGGAMPSPSGVVRGAPSATRKWAATTAYRTQLVWTFVHSNMLPQWILEVKSP